MCQYRYYYYAGCQHQETVLYDFCGKARPARHATPQPLPTETTDGRQVAGDGILDTSRPRSPSTTTSSSFAGSVPTSFTSLQDSLRDNSSIQHIPLHHQPRRHSEPSASYITGLSPFINATLGHWVSQQVFGTVPDPNELGQDERDGIMTRKMVSGSPSLLTLGAVRSDGRDSLQHGRFPNELAPLVSQPTESRLQPLQNVYDSIEETIDCLKKDLQHIKEMDQCSTSRIYDEQADKNMPFSPTELPHVRESAAARLQRFHEADEAAHHDDSKAAPVISQSAHSPRPLNPSEFPDLKGSAPRRSAHFTSRASSVRKPSYASMATNCPESVAGFTVVRGSPDGFSDTWSDSQLVQTPTMTAWSWDIVDPVSATMAPAVASAAHSSQPNVTIVADPSKSHGATPEKGAKTARSIPSSPSRQSFKMPPHFARPTESFNRRTDETLRKERDSPVSKLTKIGSPRKSIRASTAGNQKRKSLPGDWLEYSRMQSTPKQSAIATVALKDTRSSHGLATLRNKHSARSVIPSDADQPATNNSWLPTQMSSDTSPGASKMDQAIGPPSSDRTHCASSARRLRATRDQSPTCGILESFPDLNIVRELSESADSSLEQIIVDMPTRVLPDDRSHHHESKETRTPKSAETSQASASAVGADGGPRQRNDTSEIFPRKNDFPIVGNTSAIGQTEAVGLPPVANTTKARRGSRGHLLLPIRARLSKAGLLDERASESSLPRLTDVSEVCVGDIAESDTAALPHPRTHDVPSVKPASQTVSRTSSETVALPSTTESALSRHWGQMISDMTNVPYTNKTCSMPSGGGRERSNTAPLRPTAQEFIPTMSHVTMVPEDGVSPTANAPLGFYSQQSEWALPASEEYSTAPTALPLHDGTTTQFNNCWVNNIFDQPNSSATPPISAPQNVPQRPIDRASTSPILKLRLSPRKKTVQWNLQDVDGEETRACFGRAPPPPGFLPSEPSPPNSDLTSSASRSDRSSWSIMDSTHGWTGGGGREIRYRNRGWPNSTYVPSDNRILRDGSIRFDGSAHSPSSPDGPGDSLPLAPRSMRQWAAAKAGSQQFGSRQLEPCGDVEVTHAVEMMPAPGFGKSLMYGWCPTCVG